MYGSGTNAKRATARSAARSIYPAQKNREVPILATQHTYLQQRASHAAERIHLTPDADPLLHMRPFS